MFPPQADEAFHEALVALARAILADGQQTGMTIDARRSLTAVTH
jgi:hypothetical protein